MEYVLLIVGLVAAGFGVIFLILRRIVFRWLNGSAQIEHIKQEMEKMLVELNHTAANNVDLIEAKIAELKEMLDLADKRIALAKKETIKRETQPVVYSSVAKPAAGKEPLAHAVAALPLRDRVLNLYHSGFTAPMIAGQLGATVGEVELIISLAEKG